MQNKGSIIVGLFIIALGIIFLGNTFNIWDITIFFKGWWTLFIIIPSLVGMFEHKTIRSSVVGLVIGILLLLSCRGLLKWDMMGEVFIAFLLIYIGICIIFKPKHKDERKPEEDYLAIFSGNEGKVVGKVKSSDMISIFGGVKLDFRDATIKEDVTFECVSIFGGIDLTFNDDVNVKYSGVPIFGGVKCEKQRDYDPKNPTVNIDYVCLFGGITLKK